MRLTVIMLGLLVISPVLAYEPVGAGGRPCNITRGIYCASGPLLSTVHWDRYGDGFEFSEPAAHSGRASAKVTVTDAGGRGAGISQVIQLGQTTPQPIKIAGWSKAEKVEGASKDLRYSLYVDFRYADGTSLNGQCVYFSPGTHDWEYGEMIVRPAKPLAQARFYAFVRQRTGVVFFDDLYFGPVDGPNLLKNPGFEPGDRNDVAARDTIYSTYADLNANAIHTYLSGSPDFWQGSAGQGKEQVRTFLAQAKAHGIGVWVTIGEPPEPAIKNARDPLFPQYRCVNGPWGAAWTRSLSLAAVYDFAGISLVPDEYNWTNGPLKERYNKHIDPQVVEFYRQLPAMCDCPVCMALYEKTGATLPKLPPGMQFPEQTPLYLRYLKQRYDSTTGWIARSVAAIKRVNPKVRTDSLICVSPICSDFWWGTGVAWDRIGAESGLDFPTTDPYILLHNYLGDSTHWYVTETAAHLTGCSPKRQCGIVLEASRLRQEYRELDPVEIYGSALSAVGQGAKELAWWHYSHITDQSKTTDQAEVSRACVRGVYGLLKDADPWLGGLRAPKFVAYLHSRASDDFWRFYTQPKPSPVLTHQVNDPRYAAVAQKEVLYTLFRRGLPVDLYYLESAQEQKLKDYRAIIVPFAFALADRQVALLRRLAESGKTVIIISEMGALDELGTPRRKPALLELCGLPEVPTDETAQHVRQVGRGQVVFLGSAYGYGLPLNRDNQKRTRTERILPDPLNLARVAVLDQILKQACGTAPWALGQMTERDIETRLLVNAAGERVLLAINWENEPVQVELQVPVARGNTLTGYRLGPDGKRTASTIRGQASGGSLRFKVELRPQEACLWHG